LRRLLALEQFPQLAELVARRCAEPGDLEQAMEWVERVLPQHWSSALPWLTEVARARPTALQELRPWLLPMLAAR
jgi:hypothetical protein